MFRTLNLFFVFCLLWLPLSITASAQENLTPKKLNLLSYHSVPPFMTGTKTGLTFDLAVYLNQLQSDYIFEVKMIPRKRLDTMLDQKNVIIPWVTSAWFGPDAAQIYQWSRPIMKGGSIYIWKAGREASFARPKDLVGYKLGGIRGYHYVGVDPLVQSGQIRRTDVTTERQLLQMLRLNRVDVGIIPLKGAKYLIHENNWNGDFSTAAHHSYTRHIMSNNLDQPIVNFLNRAAQKMLKDESWHRVMHKYDLTPYSPETVPES